MAKIIDTGIRNGDLPYILRMGGILILLGIIGLACSLTAQFFAAKAAVGFGTALRKELLIISTIFLHRNRYGRNGYSDYKNDQRCEPGSVGSESDVAPFSALSVYRIRSHDHGVYH